jgi:hypothetical protein
MASVEKKTLRLLLQHLKAASDRINEVKSELYLLIVEDEA